MYQASLGKQISLLQGVYWVTFCTISGFATIFLLNKGLSNTEIGSIIAIASLISVFAQFGTGFMMDKFPKLTINKIMLSYVGITCVVNLFLVLFNENNWLVALLYCLAIVFLYNIQPLMTTLVYDYVNTGANISFSFTRGIGSLTYAVTSFFLGRWLDQHSVLTIPLISTIGMFVLVILLISLPKINRTQLSEEIDFEKGPGLGIIQIFKKYPSLGPLVFSLTMIFSFHTIVNVFIPQIIENIGGTTAQVGYAIALAALLEIPAMLGFSKLERKINVTKLLNLSVIFFFIRGIIYYSAISFITIIPAQVLQCVSFAIITPAYAHYINEMMSQDDRVKGQTFVMAGVTLGNVIGSFVGGKLLDFTGVDGMLRFGIYITFIGMLTMFYSMKIGKKQKTSN